MIALFVLKICVGITMMWWLMPRKEVTDGFFRIQMRLVLGLAVLTALMLAGATTFPPETAAADVAEEVSAATSANASNVASTIRYLSIAVAVISYAGSVFWALGRRQPGNICIYLLTILPIIALATHALSIPNATSQPQQLLSDFSTAAVVGSMLTAMLLGHWYLTTPTMSINPLWWFNKAIIASALFRLAASVWALTAHGLPTGDVTLQIWLGMRWVGGIVAPVFVALMVWRILKHRNTQSATGVLFAGLILVFMGEMTAALLERQSQVPY